MNKSTLIVRALTCLKITPRLIVAECLDGTGKLLVKIENRMMILQYLSHLLSATLFSLNFRKIQ